MDLVPPPDQCPFLDLALGLLETDPGLLGSDKRRLLMKALTVLEEKAIAAGADERSLKVIQSARAIVDFDQLPPLPEVYATV